MKKKLLSVTAVALAMVMTTSAFAATAKGKDDANGDGKVDIGDAQTVVTAIGTANADANIDGEISTKDNYVDVIDAKLWMQRFLQPSTVEEGLGVRIYTTGEVFKDVTKIDDSLGGGVIKADTEVAPNGMTVLKDGIVKETTIGAMIDKVAAAVTQDEADKLANTLNNICFHNANKGDVYLKNDNGWAMFCWAVESIVPLKQSTADDCLKQSKTDAEAQTSERTKALEDVKAALGVGKNEDGTGEIKIDAAQIGDIVANLKKAFPTTMTADEIYKADDNDCAAARVLNITSDKYDFAVDSANIQEAKITADGPFVQALIKLANYDTATIADVQATFGDKITLSSKRNDLADAKTIEGVFEVYELAAAK